MPATALDPVTALSVIDLQRGLASYPLPTPFTELVAHTARLARAFRAAKLPVVLVTAGWSNDGGDRLQVRTERPPRIGKMPPDFADVVPELGPEPGDIVVLKRQPSAFYGTELDLQLRRRKVAGIVIVGVSTSNGVESTARAANERMYNLTFAMDAIGDPDPECHAHCAAKIFPKLGELDSTDAILRLVSASARSAG